MARLIWIKRRRSDNETLPVAGRPCGGAASFRILSEFSEGSFSSAVR